MAEGSNIEISQHLAGSTPGHHLSARWHRLLEFAEVLVLAVVAIATAWSGFQASKWDGHQAYQYAIATDERIYAEVESNKAAQELMYDAGLFTEWLKAKVAGNTELQTALEARFTDDYRPAFDAWKQLVDSGAPAPSGPRKMPEYRNSYLEESERLNAQASATFDEGTKARETSDDYVRATVLFASVLFLIALGQRIKNHGPRLGVNVIAFLLLAYSVLTVVGLPRR